MDALQAKTILVTELLNHYFDRLNLRGLNLQLGYHQPCHLKLLDHADSSLELLSRLPGIDLTDFATHCCGMAGSWGLAKQNDGLSRRIGTGLAEALNRPDLQVGVTDCPTCRLQMESLAERAVKHPVELVDAASI
jgi:Fe-S oxidoreductase